MTTATKTKPGGQAVEQDLPVNDIEPHPLDPRIDPDKGIDELAASIDDVGLIARVVVRPLDGGKFQLLAGGRRWRAFKKARRKTIPAVVRECGDEDALVIMARENNDREPLSTIEQGRAYWNLIAPVEKGGLALKPIDVARRFGVSPATILVLTGALDLPKGWREKIVADGLGYTQVQALVRYSEDRQLLAECERDYVRNDFAWRTSKLFLRSVEKIREDLRGPKSKAEEKERPVIAPPRAGKAAGEENGKATRMPVGDQADRPRPLPPPLPIKSAAIARGPQTDDDEAPEPAAGSIRPAAPTGTSPSDDRFADVRGHEFWPLIAPFAGDRRALESIAGLAQLLAARIGAARPVTW